MTKKLMRKRKPNARRNLRDRVQSRGECGDIMPQSYLQGQDRPGSIIVTGSGIGVIGGSGGYVLWEK